MVHGVGLITQTMITTAIINIFAGALYLVFQFIPQVTGAPEWWTENVYPALGIFTGLNQFPIIGTLLQIGVLALSFMIAWQGIYFASMIYNKIRGSG